MYCFKSLLNCCTACRNHPIRHLFAKCFLSGVFVSESRLVLVQQKNDNLNANGNGSISDEDDDNDGLLTQLLAKRGKLISNRNVGNINKMKNEKSKVWSNKMSMC